MLTIDLNADLGEGVGCSRLEADTAVLSLVSSASIACGFHAGDTVTMRDTVRAAARLGVAIGAHPGYADRAGFGRRAMAATPNEITAMVVQQISALAEICASEGASLRYVKPHGALYNRASTDRATADAVTAAVRLADPSLLLLGLAGGCCMDAGEAAGVRVVAEAFADRAYAADGTLLPRSEPGAVLHDADSVAARAVRLVREGLTDSHCGVTLKIHAQSLCVHGDNPRAPELLRALRQRLTDDGIKIVPFA